MINLIGQSLGRYQILEQLGEGGMAVVYKAYDTRLERQVAIKVITPSKQLSEKSLKRFEFEAKALAQLNHSNIVKILDFGEQDGTPYLVMEFLPGGTLKQKMGKAFPAKEAARLLAPVARALEYVHKHEIVHRDVKPANILITDAGQPMLSDFGIAKLLDPEETSDFTNTGMGIGTPEYMAPEQGTDVDIDLRADIYSLGVVFYELVTGRKPFQAITPMSVMLKKVTDPLPRPTQFVPNLSPAVEKVLIKALEKVPANRYQSMHEFANALEAIARDEVGGVSRTKSTRWLFGGLALGLVILALIIASLRPIPAKPAPGQQPEQMNTPTETNPHPTATETSIPSPTPTSKPVIQVEINPGDSAEMAVISEGSFAMGSDGSADPYFWGAEKPIHKVYLKPYFIYRTEVTNAMYQACVAAKNCRRPESPRSRTRKDYYENTQFSNYPVIYVTWQDAFNYCKWAGGRLPSEAEWEKAARGEDGRLFPWGNETSAIGLAANKHGDTEAAGKYPNGVSPYGIFDMAGNVLEWVNDYFSADYYKSSPEENPIGPDFGSRYGIRGGSWYSLIDGLRTTARSSLKPGEALDTLGFRCVVDVIP